MTERVLINKDVEVRESFYYIGTEDAQLSLWRHSPSDAHCGSHAVLICAPLGYEQVHTYRALRRLAENLAALGFSVFRFDYRGAGDSNGAMLSADSVSHWLSDIKTVANHIGHVCPGFPQTWLGLRLGGTLAYMAAEHQSVENLVLWEPILSGRSYVRELTALSKLAAHQGDEGSGFIESAGFMLSNEAADEIKAIKLTRQCVPQSLRRVLFIARKEMSGREEFLDNIRDIAVSIKDQSVEDYQSMMAVPHKNTVQDGALVDIAEWLGVGVNNNLSTISDQIDGSSHAAKGTSALSAETIVESGCFFGKEDKLFGVLTGPHESSVPNKARSVSSKCIILTNAGSVHHIGPNRVYTQIARLLAPLGWYVLRLDMENVGDSKVLDASQDSHPYQQNAVENIEAVVQRLYDDHGINEVVIAGICSGGHTAFHAALSASSTYIKEVLMINPLTFYWNPATSLEIPSTLQLLSQESGYKKSLRDWDKWKGFLFSKEKLLNAFGFVFKRLMKVMDDRWRDLETVVLGKKQRLALDIEKLWAKDIAINFIFSSSDPGLDLLNADARWTVKKGRKNGRTNVHVVKHADHTFSTKEGRDRLFDILKQKFDC